MATTEVIVYEEHVETDTHLHRAVIIHTDDPPTHELPLDKEHLENASQSPERVQESVRDMTEDADVDITVYQPGEFESPVHECLQRQAYLLVIISTQTKNEKTTSEAKAPLNTATDELAHSQSRHFTTGFEVMPLKYKQDHILPLLEEVKNS